MTRQAALSAYRHSLRATRIAFQGDATMLLASRAEIKKGMRNPPNPELSPAEQVEFLNGVSTFLMRNIVQGVKQSENEKYHLNIHEHTELGDNDTILKAKKTLQAQGGGCCGGGDGLYK